MVSVDGAEVVVGDLLRGPRGWEWVVTAADANGVTVNLSSNPTITRTLTYDQVSRNTWDRKDPNHALTVDDVHQIVNDDVNQLKQQIKDAVAALLADMLMGGMANRLAKLYQAGQVDDTGLTRAVSNGWITDAQRLQIESTSTTTTTGTT